MPISADTGGTSEDGNNSVSFDVSEDGKDNAEAIPCPSQTEIKDDATAQDIPQSDEDSRSVSDSGNIDCRKRRIRRKREKQSAPVLIDNRSFLALLIRSFVSFMLITVLSVLLIFLFALWVNGQDPLSLNVRTISNFDEFLKRGRYWDIPVSRLCGKSGWVCIVDVQGDFVYSSDGVERSYTRSELDCIHSFESDEVITVQSFKMPSGDYNHLISRSLGDGSRQYLLLDAELHILSGSIPTTKTQFTQQEFELYTYNTRHSGVVMEKYYFKHGEDDLYVVYLDTNNGEGVTPYVLLIIIAVGISALLITSVALYIKYINRHVQKPLKALSSAMTDFAKNGYREYLTYQGSMEFEQLVYSFNEMVSLLNASETQRQLLEQDRQRMLAGLSHDLKTPITVIQGFSKAMRDGLVDEKDRQKYLNLILNRSENMGALINGFYEYSKLDHPDFKLSVAPIDVAELTRTYIAGRYDEFELQGYSLNADITEEKLVCEVDRQQLIRVFENLTDNFFKYTPNGSTLFLRIAKQDSNALIIFSDNGSGIQSDTNDDIFAPFVVGEQSRSRQGSGLGLAVCKKIVTAHGGSIALNQTPPDPWHTEFDITLPLKDL